MANNWILNLPTSIIEKYYTTETIHGPQSLWSYSRRQIGEIIAEIHREKLWPSPVPRFFTLLHCSKS